MKILSLNIWGGRRFEKLMPFIREWAKGVDVFCFQEMIDGGPAEPMGSMRIRGNMYQEVVAALPDFTGFKFLNRPPVAFSKEIAGMGVSWGEAIFVNKRNSVLSSKNIFLHRDGLIDDEPTSFGTGTMLGVVIESAGKQYAIGTVHGLFQEFWKIDPGKKDTPERIEQSKRILDFVKAQECPSIIIGDFNLRPETESVAMLSRELRNLLSEYGITNTRNYEYVEMEKYKDYIADYAFADKRLVINDFKVLPDVVSDHAPLFVEITD